MARQRGNNRETSNRHLRMGEEVRHALASILLEDELHDEVIDKLSITVSEVRLAPNLRGARVYVMPLAGQNAQDAVAKLRAAAPRLRALVGKKVYMRYLPELTFVLDETFDTAGRIQDLLNKPEVRQDVAAPSAPDVDTGADADGQ